MGCCGCNNKSSAITAGIFGMIQSIIGLIFNAFFLNLYTSYPYSLVVNVNNLDERFFLVYATSDVEPIIFILLAIATILHSIWLISSIILLIGNANNNSCCVRQWVVWTSFVIIGDMILPVILGASTYGSLINVIESTEHKVQSSVSEDGGTVNRFADNVVSSVSLDFYKYYIILLFSFCKLGLITIIINICLNVFTNRRATEISCPRGYVMGTTVTVIQSQPSVPGMIQVGPGTVVTQGPVVYSNAYPQSGTANPYYPGNIPLQPAVAFAPQLSEPGYPESPQAEGICNPLAEPLLRPEDRKDY